MYGTGIEMLESGVLLLATFIPLIFFVLSLKSFVIDEAVPDKVVNTQVLAVVAYLSALLLSFLEGVARWLNSDSLRPRVAPAVHFLTTLASYTAPLMALSFSWPQGHPPHIDYH